MPPLSGVLQICAALNQGRLPSASEYATDKVLSVESKLGSDIELEGFSGKIAAAFYQGEEKAYLAVSKEHSHLLEGVSVVCASTDDLFEKADSCVANDKGFLPCLFSSVRL